MKTKRNRTYKKCLTKHRMEMRKQIIIILAVVVAASIIGHEGQKQAFKEEIKAGPVLTHRLPVNADKRTLTIQDKIAIAATKADINVNTALAIAQCESGQNPKARNKQGSSASGLYQFIMKTWWNNCDGDVMNVDDNISCFMKLYPNHPNWWECHKILARK